MAMRHLVETGTLAACAAAIEIGSDPGRIKVFPYGTWRGRNGLGPYTLAGREHAERVITATAAAQGPIDLMVDYDHQAPFAAVPGVGGRAEASGWIKVSNLSAEEDGLWADVDWTAAASAKIAAREYRYVSPFFLHDKQGRITRIVNVALVNIPNFDLPAVASALPHGDARTMNELDKILTALGLQADAGVDAAVAAIAELKKPAASLAAVATALGVTEGEDVAAAATAIKAKADNPDPKAFVPATVADELRGRLAVIDGERADAAVASAITTGKLTPAERDWAKAYFAKEGAAAFASMIALRPAMVTAGAAVESGGELKQGEPDAAEIEAAASLLGVSAEEFSKARKAGY